MTTPTLLPANPELVLQHWVATLPDFSDAMVATTLPQDNSTWAASGFITVGPVVGGGTFGDQGALRNPIVQVSAWAVPAGTTTASTSGRPPWYKAAELIERIRAGCFDEEQLRRQLDLGSRYRGAFVSDIYPTGEPSRINGEPLPVARYDIDLTMLWAELPV